MSCIRVYLPFALFSWHAEENNECLPNSCEHNGECIDGLRNYTCNCTSVLENDVVKHYAGRNCSTGREDGMEILYSNHTKSYNIQSPYTLQRLKLSSPHL